MITLWVYTSIATMANEKTSDSLLMVVSPLRTSGAANRTVGPSVKDRADSRSEVATMRSRPAMHGWPVDLTRTLAWYRLVGYGNNIGIHIPLLDPRGLHCRNEDIPGPGRRRTTRKEGKDFTGRSREETYETETICLRMRGNVLCQTPTRHPN